MNKILKYILWFVLVILIVIVLNFIFSSVKTKQYRYDIIENQNPKIINLFKDSIQTNLKFKTAFGNKNEQIYIYDYNEYYNLIVWNITGFSDITPSNINVVENNQFEQINFNPLTYTEWGNPKIKLLSQADSLNAKKIIIHINEGFTLNRHKKQSDLLYLNINSKGFALSDTTIAYKLKVEFEKSLNYDMCFVNRGINFQVIVLKSNNKEFLFNEHLLNMLKSY